LFKNNADFTSPYLNVSLCSDNIRDTYIFALLKPSFYSNMEDVSIMKKTTLLLSTLIACAMGMSVAQATQTVSLGYAQAKVDDFKDPKGITAKYHYQGDSALGIIGSFTYLSGKKDYNQRAIGFSSHESADVKD